ncbi:hypothetical protein B0O99DRAFT_687971 [Bisporella sp. PMI_857]|nr:hypothetical protein B0O99DRAFT_687971 [Bisporella sp. PMI_857]
MKFSYLFTILSLLLVTAFAIPIGEVQDADSAIEARAAAKPAAGKPSGGKPTGDKPPASGKPATGPATPSTLSVGQYNYNAIKHLTTKVGWHAFSIAWDKVEISNDPEMKALTEMIDGSHIGILVGEIKADNTFDGTYYHIIYRDGRPKPEKRNGAPMKVVFRQFDAKAKPEIKVKSLHGTPRIHGTAVAPIAQNVLGSKTYHIQTFNCKTYSDQVWAAIK